MGPIREHQTALVVFLDYSVIDHIQRVNTQMYKGKHEDALGSFKAFAVMKKYELWMADITRVEMIIGRENVSINNLKFLDIVKKDEEKVEIIETLGVRWLSYPASKLDDEYSRLDETFRLEWESNWDISSAFERRLEKFKGVSIGDARQIVSMVHGFDRSEKRIWPTITWFVSEDAQLCTALRREVKAGQLPELVDVCVGSVSQFVSAT